ncbi:aminoglycoside phosphotransferase family protein [Thermoplasmatota archaeon]
MNQCSLEHITKKWDLVFQKERHDLKISGSPERTDYRVVIQDKNNELYVLEKISENLYKHKLMICKTLDYFNKKGLKKIQPYLKNNYQEYISEVDNEYWQIIPYIQNNSLNRPDYVFDKWRGPVLADFLFDLWNYGKNITFFEKNNPFDLKQYFLDMTKKIEEYNKDEYIKLKNCIKFIEHDFLNIYYDIPIIFCHGDYHPLNIIWSKKSIKSVIDWEFLGYKPEIYDIANLLGCIGIEEPTSLINNLAESFILKIKESKIISEISFEYLIEFIITLRFAWLAEWFRKKDNEMINLEIRYMNLLIEKKDLIKKELKL